MSGVDELREEIASLEDEEIAPFLVQNSGLAVRETLGGPGPGGGPGGAQGGDEQRLNLALVHAAAEEAPPHLFQDWVRTGAKEAPNEAPEVALVVAGAVGMGRLIAEGEARHVDTVRTLASDPRWRVREGVTMAMHRIGREDPSRMLDIAEEWATGQPLEQRAAVAAIAQPELLEEAEHARRALDLLDDLTEALHEARTHDDEALIALRKALGVAWSAAVAALPEEGRHRFEAWLAVDDPDVRWVLEQNLKQRPMHEVAPEWVERTLEQLGGGKEGP